MRYSEMRYCLQVLGVWAPPESGLKNPSLRLGSDGSGAEIEGVYLNETDSGQAYLTLDVDPNLPRNGKAYEQAMGSGHWNELPVGALRGEHIRHVYLIDDNNCRALRDLVVGYRTEQATGLSLALSSTRDIRG